jgi:H+/Cl- antiporter ClcA
MFALFSHPRETLRWWFALAMMALVTGSASAAFILSLDAVTRQRFTHPWLLFLLPVSGVFVAWVYRMFGKSADRGNHLLIDEIHQPGAGVPARMAPLILFGTLATHICGGSAGREGTALQMGGGIAAGVARITRLPAAQIRLLLMAGIAAGFGSVFGTPVAGAVFALEVLVIGRIQYDALVPCLVAAVLADQTCRAWGIVHSHDHVAKAPIPLEAPWLMMIVVIAAISFGMAGSLFAKLSHWVANAFQRWVSVPILRPFAGGLLVILMVQLCGSQDFLGLGVLESHPGAVTLSAVFAGGEIPASAWIWKMLFTVVTLSSGFKGGEVTPLFFIGATLGHTLAGIFGVPADFLASLGFVAIFAAATNTPLASTLLGVELFGAHNTLYYAIACVIAYRFSSHRGIYPGQPVATRKFRKGTTKNPDARESTHPDGKTD